MADSFSAKDLLPALGGHTPGLPNNPLPLVFEEFSGLNTKATRPAIKDAEMAWCDGFMPIGPSNLRILPGLGTALYTATAPLTIQWFGFGNIGANAYCYALLSDGSVKQMDTTTGAVTAVMGAGTILNPSSILGFSQWGRQYILFSASQTNGYWIWDGTTLYTAGDTGPDGETVSSGISGTTIEVYGAHVWVGDEALVNFSAPGTPSDFTTANGGGSFTSSDSFLRASYTTFKQTNGYLYLLADSSINYISNVDTTGSPPTTTYNNTNIDPQTGTPWPGSVQLLSRNIIFANSIGVHVSYGGAVTKVSDALDGIYNSVPGHGTIVPSAAMMEIFAITVYMLLLPVIDSYTKQPVNKLLMWDGKKWWSSDQDVQLNFITSQEINSVLTAWGTDGSSIYPLFNTPSSAFTKRVQSKLFPAPSYVFTKTGTRLYGVLYDDSPNSFNLTGTIDNEAGGVSFVVPNPGIEAIWTNSAGDTANWTNSGGGMVNWAGSGLGVFGPLPLGQTGRLLGFTFISTDTDLTLVSATLIGSTAELHA